MPRSRWQICNTQPTIPNLTPTRSDNAPRPIYPGMATTLTEPRPARPRQQPGAAAAAKPQRSWICLLQFALFLPE